MAILEFCLPQKGNEVATGEGAVGERKWVTDAFHTNLVEILDLSLDLGQRHVPFPTPSMERILGSQEVMTTGSL